MKPRWTAAVTAAAAVLTTLNLAIWLAGAAPRDVLPRIVEGTLGNAYGLGQTLAKATPLLWTGGAVALALRARLFNIGAEGQCLAGALCCAVVGAALPAGTPALVALPIALLAAAAGGAAPGALAGWLRGRFGTHEVLSTLMLNGLLAVLTTWLYSGPLRVGAQVHTREVVHGARLPMAHRLMHTFQGSSLNAAFPLGVAALLLMAWYLHETRGGLALRALGASPGAAEALGVDRARTTTRAMALSGALAGLGGVHFVLGVKGYGEQGLGGGVGFVGIAVAMLGGGRPLGIVLAAVLFGMLAQGGLVVNATVPADVLNLAQAATIVAVAAVTARAAPNARSRSVQTLLVYLAQTLTASAPLCLAALGGVISERSGVATISLEAYLLGGAFAAAAVALATASLPLALLGAMALGAALAAVFAWSTISLRANAIVAGVAVNLLAAAGTRVALKVLYDSAANSPALPIGRASTASIGAAALSEALRAPAVLLTPLVAWALHVTLRDTVFGLRVTACGEHPDAARSLGVSVPRVRAAALVLGGAVAALGGAQLALFQHEFVAYMSGGRGFLALAAVILGRWRPLRAVGWAVGIGALQALEATLSSRAGVPHALLQAMPFALTLLAVAGPWGRARAPAALG